MPRFEVEVSPRKITRFRAAMQEMGIKIVTDGEKNENARDDKQRRIENVLSPLASTVDDDKVEVIAAAYSDLLHDAFQTSFRHQLTGVNIHTKEDIQAAGLRILDIVEASRQRQVMGFALVVTKYGLVTGERMQRTEAAQRLGMSPEYGQHPESLALRRIYDGFAEENMGLVEFEGIPDARKRVSLSPNVLSIIPPSNVQDNPSI